MLLVENVGFKSVNILSGFISYLTKSIAMPPDGRLPVSNVICCGFRKNAFHVVANDLRNALLSVEVTPLNILSFSKFETFSPAIFDVLNSGGTC